MHNHWPSTLTRSLLDLLEDQSPVARPGGVELGFWLRRRAQWVEHIEHLARSEVRVPLEELEKSGAAITR